MTSGIVNHGELLSFTFDLQVTTDVRFFRLRTTGLLITGQPRAQTVFAGNAASFQVTTRGSGPLRHQWYRGSQRIIDGTNAVLTIPVASLTDAGSYRVVVADHRDAVTSADASLTVLTTPVITRQPLDVLIASNGLAQFSVVAEGVGQLAYQWKKDGVVLGGATASNLSVGPVSMDSDGGYSVVVFDANGSVESLPARLTVLIPPAFLIQPASQTVNVGDDVTFSVSMSGNPLPFGYEWRRGFTSLASNMVNSTTASFTLRGVRTNDAGAYRVVVRNLAFPAGKVSAIANLTVTTNAPTAAAP